MLDQTIESRRGRILSARAVNALRLAHIITLRDIIQAGRRGLLGLRAFGLTSLQQVEELLEANGLSWDTAIEQEPSEPPSARRAVAAGDVLFTRRPDGEMVKVGEALPAQADDGEPVIVRRGLCDEPRPIIRPIAMIPAPGWIACFEQPYKAHPLIAWLAYDDGTIEPRIAQGETIGDPRALVGFARLEQKLAP